MPNYCYNCITISGSAEDLQKLIDLVKGEGTALDFNKILPYPKEFADKDDASNGMYEGFNGGGYNWCRINWGTKWNVEAELQGVPDDEEIVFTFDSAWSPSCPITLRLGEMFPALKFCHYYEEPGMCFEGDYIVDGGKVIEDDCRYMPIYVCNKCSSEQVESSCCDCFTCWSCGGEDFTRKEDKDE